VQAVLTRQFVSIFCGGVTLQKVDFLEEFFGNILHGSLGRGENAKSGVISTGLPPHTWPLAF
jgi:hypothetical protein